MKENLFEKFVSDKDFDVLNCTNRWNGHRVQRNETVAEHTYFVVFFSRMLLELLYRGRKNTPLEVYRDVMDRALYHDLSEVFDHDVNYAVKYNPWNGEQIKKLLSEYVRERAKEKFVTENNMGDDNSIVESANALLYQQFD